MKIRRHCKNCGTVIDMSSERHYVVAVRKDLCNLVHFDAFDCQNCGCQYIAGVREINIIKEEK